MKIPSDKQERTQFVSYVIDCCMASSEDRRSLYDRRRRYYLYGMDAEQKAKFNRLKSHLKLVASFLFSPDGLVYNIAAPPNSDDGAIRQFLALQDDFNEEVHDSGIADDYAEAVQWALNYDTMIVKMGWNDKSGQMFAKLVPPSQFGFFNEGEVDFSSQTAMNHRYAVDYDEACERLVRAGRKDFIPRLQMTTSPSETGLPSPMSSIIISAVAGVGVNETITGSANPNYNAVPLFKAQTQAPQVMFDETWIWDNGSDDWRIFHSISGELLSDSKETVDAIVKAGGAEYNSKTNWFLEKENPFVPITPFPLYDYAWGDAHMEDLIPLQMWSEERLQWIQEILQAQVDPLRIGHGMTGLVEEKLGLGEGSYFADDSPNGKMEEMRPPMPEDVFREFNEIGGLMMEASGLTETVAGKSSGGARGGQQQKQMQITGGGQIRKVAVRLEQSLVRMGEIGLRLKMKNDPDKIRLEDGSTFIPAQVPEGYSLRVDGHSHSPLFTMESREVAAMLFKAQAIDRSWLIRMINPTQKNNLLHALSAREKAESKQHQMELMAHAEKKKK